MISKQGKEEIVRWIYDDHGIPMWLSRKIVSKVAELILNALPENGDMLEWELLWKPIVRNARKLDKILLSTPTGIRGVVTEIIAIEEIVKP